MTSQSRARDVLARTFALEDQDPTSPSKQRFVEKLEVSTLSKTILVYHRHLACLIDSTPYVAISHVWDAEVTDVQYRKAQSTASAAEVARHILDGPTRISLGIAVSLKDNMEVWHDYISVSQ